MRTHGAFELDLARHSAALGPDYAALLGYGPVTVREGLDRWFDRCHPTNLEPLRDAIGRCAAGEAGSLHLVVAQRANNGAWQTVRLTAVVIERDDTGQGVRLAGDAANLTGEPSAGATDKDEVRLRARLDAVHALQSNSQAILYALERRGGALTPVMVSGNVDRLLGFTEAEALVPDWWLEHVHPDDREQALTGFSTVSTQDAVVHEYRFVRKDGVIVWVQDSARVIRRDATGPLEIVGSWTDITARHETERALRDRDARLSLAMEAANQAFWELDLRHGSTVAPVLSAEYARMLGYDPETFHESEAAWRKRTHPDDVEPVTTAWADYLAGRSERYSVEFRQRTSRGEWAWIHASGTIVERDGFDRPVRALGIHVDITDRKRAELRADRLSRLNAAFARCNAAIVHSSQESDLFPQLCEIVVQYGGVAMAWIGVADEDTATVRPVASYGDGREYLDGLVISTHGDEPLGQGPTSATIRKNQPHWEDNVAADAATASGHDRGNRFGWVASGCLPLVRAGRVVGVLTMYAREREVFDETGRALLADLAAEISFALDTFDIDRRRAQAETERAEAEERYRALFDDSSVPAIVVDPMTAVVVDANQAAAGFYGWDLATLRGMPLAAINALGAERLRETMREVREHGQARLRLQHRLASGDLRDVEVHATSIVRYRRPLLLGLVIDETARRQAERALQRTARELAEAQRLANVGSWSVHADGRFHGSDQMYLLFGLAPDSAVPDPDVFTERIHPDDRETVRAAFASNLAGVATSNVHYRVIRTEDDIRVMRTSAERRTDPDDGPYIAGATQDVTDLHTLAESVRIKTLAIESAIDAMAIADLDGRVTYVNRAFLQLWGFDSADAVIGHHASEFWASASEVAAITAALRDHRSWTGEMQAMSNRGTPLTLLVSATVVTDEHDRIVCLLGAFEDISDRRQAEISLHASLREKDALLLEVHHRVKNNLQIMSSLLRLEASRRDSAEVKGVLGDMQNRIVSMAVLHELLYRSGNVAEVDLAAYLDSLARHLFGSLAPSGRRLDLVLRLEAARVEIDLAVPCGLLVNELLSNSLKHAFPEPRSGTVTVQLATVDGGALRLTVSDTGIGLPDQFDVTRAPSLGLQLVSDLTRQLRARLEVGTTGPGASFTLSFAPRHTSAHSL